jgi:hypothetical protein
MDFFVYMVLVMGLMLTTCESQKKDEQIKALKQECQGESK